MHCVKDSERSLRPFTVEAKKWGIQMKAGLPDGNFKESSGNLQVEKREMLLQAEGAV